MKRTSFLVILFAYISCSPGQNDKVKYELDRIADWKMIEYRKTKVDTSNVGNWMPDPEISATLKLTADSSCLSPRLDFYPISLEKYIEKKLMTYLTMRGSLFPPQPNSYRSKDYYLLVWDFADYHGHTCCSCDELETELTARLELTAMRTQSHPIGFPAK